MNRIRNESPNGKEHKKYKFGSKISIIITKNYGVITGADSIEKNVHNSKRSQPVIKQLQRQTGIILKNNYVDLGYGGMKEVLGKTKIMKQVLKKAATEPKTGYLKQNHCLISNFLQRK